MRFTKNPRRRRRGVEAIEAAITLPLLTLALFGTVEVTHRWHLEKMLKIASYEAIKAGAAVDGTAADANRVFQEHTEAMGINKARLRIRRRRLFDDASPGDTLIVEGRALSSRNRPPTPNMIPFRNTMSGGLIYYRKEGI